MHIAVFALDKPDSLDVRSAARPDHLAYMSKQATVFGGPLLDDDGNMCGSLVVFEAEHVAAVEGIMAEDPYVKAGLFASVEIRAINVSIGAK